MANESQVRTKAHAKKLVANSIICTRSTSWLSGLSICDKKYVSEVIEAYIANPEARLQFVAVSLRTELGITVGISTIARTLREIIRNEKEIE